jgi:hypothetical protein
MTLNTSNPLDDQIYNDMNLKSTNELLDIWKTNDRSVWSEAGFKAIEKVLHERNVSLPAQQKAEVEEESETDTYYNIDKLSSISSIANILAWVILGGDIIAVIAYLGLAVKSGSVNLLQYLIVPANVLNLLIWCVVYILPGLFFFAVLRMLSEGVYVLLEIAENNRTH